MITILPAYHETIVLPYPAEDTYQKLTTATSNKLFRQADEKNLSFNGWVQENRFRISIRVQRVNHFIPLVIGQIEPTHGGSIVFVDYRLFPTTRLLLILWTILLTLGSAAGYYQFKHITYFVGGLGIILLIHLIAWSNFKLQLEVTRNALHRVIT